MRRAAGLTPQYTMGEEMERDTIRRIREVVRSGALGQQFTSEDVNREGATPAGTQSFSSESNAASTGLRDSMPGGTHDRASLLGIRIRRARRGDLAGGATRHYFCPEEPLERLTAPREQIQGELDSPAACHREWGVHGVAKVLTTDTHG